MEKRKTFPTPHPIFYLMSRGVVELKYCVAMTGRKAERRNDLAFHMRFTRYTYMHTAIVVPALNNIPCDQ